MKSKSPWANPPKLTLEDFGKPIKSTQVIHQADIQRFVDLYMPADQHPYTGQADKYRAMREMMLYHSHGFRTPKNKNGAIGKKLSAETRRELAKMLDWYLEEFK